jgi:hypothetical protein
VGRRRLALARPAHADARARALGEQERPVHLAFLGTGRPALDPDAVPASEEEARRFARDRGLEDRVHFNPGWVPYAERGAYLLEADVGVCAHHDHLEARFSFRTRVLDHFWAGLPSVVSSGDSIGELVDLARARLCGPPEDDEGFAAALAALLGDEARHEAVRERVAAFAPSLRWSECARPLLDFCLDPAGRPARRPPRGNRGARDLRAVTPTCSPTCASAAAPARPPGEFCGTSGAPAGTVPDRAAGRGLAGRARYPLLFAAGALLSGLTILNGINPHDEGLVLQAAARIVHGEVPYRDFYANYGPGQYYLDGALDFVFGPSLLTWRIVRVALDALVAVLAYALVRREGSEPLAVLAWVAVLAAMAHPTLPHPNAAALALAFGAILLARRSPVAAGVLAGVAFAFRFDLGAAAAVGAVVAAAGDRGAPARDSRPAERRLRAPLRALLAALVTGAVLVLPFVLIAPGDFWNDTFGFALAEQSLQRLPLPGGWDGGFELNKILAFYMPYVLIGGLALWLVAAHVAPAAAPRLGGAARGARRARLPARPRRRVPPRAALPRRCRCCWPPPPRTRGAPP